MASEQVIDLVSDEETNAANILMNLTSQTPTPTPQTLGVAMNKHTDPTVMNPNPTPSPSKRKASSDTTTSSKRARPAAAPAPPAGPTYLAPPASSPRNKTLWATPEYKGPDPNVHTKLPSGSVPPVASPSSLSATTPATVADPSDNTTGSVIIPKITVTPPTPPKTPWTKAQLLIFAETLQNALPVQSLSEKLEKPSTEILDAFGFLVYGPIFAYASDELNGGEAKRFMGDREAYDRYINRVMDQVHEEERKEEERKEEERKKREGKRSGEAQRGEERIGAARAAADANERTGVQTVVEANSGGENGAVGKGKGGGRKSEGVGEGAKGGKKVKGVEGGVSGEGGKGQE